MNININPDCPPKRLYVKKNHTKIPGKKNPRKLINAMFPEQWEGVNPAQKSAQLRHRAGIFQAWCSEAEKLRPAQIWQLVPLGPKMKVSGGYLTMPTTKVGNTQEISVAIPKEWKELLRKCLWSHTWYTSWLLKQAIQMASYVTVLEAMTNKLSLIPRTCKMEKENQLPQAIL